MKNIILSAIFPVLFYQASEAQTLKDAIRLNENEQQDEAAAIFEKLIMADPGNGNLYYLYGENFIDAENTEKAAEAFQRGLEKAPANPLNLVGQAELKLLSGDLTGGKSIIEQAVKSANGKNALLLMEAGEAMMRYKKAQDLISAQTYLESAVKLEPKNPEAYNLLGDLYSELNNGTLAAQNYNKALELDKNQVKAVLHKGQLYKRSTNYEGAIVEFENALKINPDFAPAYRELGETYFKMKKIEKAKENYKRYLELSKNNTGARIRYAYFLYESEAYKSALEEIGKIGKIDSSNIYMLRVVSYINYENDLNEVALKTISRVFEMTANDTSKRISKDYAYYGKALAKTGNDSLGFDYIWRAIEMDPRNADHYEDLGKMSSKIKKHHISVKVYRKKIENSNKVTSADYFNLGKALYLNKEYQSADSAFIKVMELSPTYPNGYLYSGRTLSQLDTAYSTLAAITPYERYISLVSADSVSAAKYSKELIEANSYIAVAYLRKKDCKLSLEYWNKVLAIDPKVQQATDAINIIKQSKDCK